MADSVPSSHAAPPAPEALDALYHELRRYTDLDDTQLAEASRAWQLIQPARDSMVDDFYEEILRHAPLRDLLDDRAQVQRLKQSLARWLEDLFAGPYDQSYVLRRWQIGFRHVQIGLPSIWVSMGMSRLRDRALGHLQTAWTGSTASYARIASILIRMFDIDLALIQNAYNAESVSRRLEQERNFAEGVIQTAQAVVMVVDQQGRLLRGNAFLKRVLRIENAGGQEPSLQPNADRAELPETIDDMLAPEDLLAFRDFLQRVAATGHPEPLETDLRWEAAAPRRIRWLARPYTPPLDARPPGTRSTRPATLADGSLHASAVTKASKGHVPRPAVLCVGQDVTDLTEVQRQLVRHARLAAIGQTMTGLAHESRNAFQRSQAALETLLLDLEDRPDAVQLIERIQRAHDQLLHLYEEVLQFARPVRLELHPIHLSTLVRQTWDHLMTAGHSGDLELRLEPREATFPLRGDPFAIEQILRNLLENAVQAAEDRGNLDVTIDQDWIGPHPAVRITVRDYGRGIPEAYVNRLFEPFFTTRPRGTGLGLPIARRLAEGHGGSLTLEPAHPGTRAVLILPEVAMPEVEEPVDQEDPRRAPSEPG